MTGFTLIDGNPMEPNSGDLLSQQVNLPTGKRPYTGELHNQGWRVLTGNTRTDLWGRLVYRYEVEQDA